MSFSTWYTQKIVSKLSEILVEDQGVKKARDPGSGTLLKPSQVIILNVLSVHNRTAARLILKCNFKVF